MAQPYARSGIPDSESGRAATAGYTRPRDASTAWQGRQIALLVTPYCDGNTQVAIATVDFMARLAALVPKPRVNLTRYYGILAPNHHRSQRLGLNGGSCKT